MVNKATLDKSGLSLSLSLSLARVFSLSPSSYSNILPFRSLQLAMDTRL